MKYLILAVLLAGCGEQKTECAYQVSRTVSQTVITLVTPTTLTAEQLKACGVATIKYVEDVQ